MVNQVTPRSETRASVPFILIRCIFKFGFLIVLCLWFCPCFAEVIAFTMETNIMIVLMIITNSEGPATDHSLCGMNTDDSQHLHD